MKRSNQHGFAVNAHLDHGASTVTTGHPHAHHVGSIGMHRSSPDANNGLFNNS